MKDGSIGVGLLGLGVVGSGVFQALGQKARIITELVGRPLEVRGILVRDTAKSRSVSVPPHLLTANWASLLGDERVAIFVEVMGGEEPARTYIAAALASGRHVVTANKEVMAKHGPELLELAAQKGVNLLFEASVGGGIPIIGPLLKDLLANKTRAIHAIVNGTTNYILTRMAKDEVDFDVALKEAQALGYAEPDPTNDVEGVDAAYKLAILSTLAFHTPVRASHVYYEGISRLTAKDFRYARELGYGIKLLAIAREDNGGLQLRVHPCFISEEHPLARVDGVLNAIEVEGDLVGKVLFHGRGAGALPTASAVVGDILEIARNVSSGGAPRRPSRLNSGLAIKPVSQLTTRYYLRLNVLDRPGVFAQIAQILGHLQVSIASVIQKEADPRAGTAEIVITTHLSLEASVQEALRQLAHLPVVQEVRNFVRIEDWTP